MKPSLRPCSIQAPCFCTCECRPSVVAAAAGGGAAAGGYNRRMRQTIQRKPMQQMQQEQYRQELMQQVDYVQGGKLVFDMQPATPAAQAVQEQQQRDAELNESLEVTLRSVTTTTWEDMERMVVTHGPSMNYVTLSLAVYRLGLLVRGGAGPHQLQGAGSRAHGSASTGTAHGRASTGTAHGNASTGTAHGSAGTGTANDRGARASLPQAGTVHGGAGAGTAHGGSGSGVSPPAAAWVCSAEAGQRYQALLLQLLQHLVRTTSWFTAVQYGQVSFGMAACGYADRAFWAVFTASSERKLLSCSGHTLALLMNGVAWAGHTPTLQWLKKSELQCSKHWHATSVADATAILWAWGAFSFTPSKPVTARVLQRMLALMRKRQLSAQQLLQVLYFVGRLAAHHPSTPWLHAWCTAFQPHIQQVSPAVLSDVLLCLASLQHSPQTPFMAKLLHQLRAGLQPTHSATHRACTPVTAGQAATATDLTVGQAAAAAAAVAPHTAFTAGQPAAGAALASTAGQTAAGVVLTGTAGAAAAGHASEGAAAVLVMRPQQCMVADLVACGPMSDPQRYPHPSRDPFSQAAGGGPRQVVTLVPLQRLAAARQGDEPAQAGGAAQLDRAVGAVSQGAPASSMQGAPSMQAGPSMQEGSARDAPTAAADGSVLKPPVDMQGMAVGHMRNHSHMLEGRHMGHVMWSLTSMQAYVGQAWLDCFAQRVLDCLPSLDAVSIVDVLYGASSLAAAGGGPAAGTTLEQPLDSPPPASWAAQAVSGMPSQVQQAIIASQAVQAPLPVMSFNNTTLDTMRPPLDTTRSTLDMTRPTLDAMRLTSSVSSPPSAQQPSDGEQQQPESTQQAPGDWQPRVEAAVGGGWGASGEWLGLVLPDGWAVRLAGALCDRLDELEPDGLAQTVVALARLGAHPPAKWMDALESASLDRLPLFSAWSLPDLLVGLVSLGHQPSSEWWLSFECAMLPQLSRCPPSHLTRVAWGLAVAQHKPSSEWLHELLVAALAQLKRLDEGDLSRLLWCFARLRHRPGTRWLDSYAQEVSGRLALMSDQQLCDVCWALAVLGHRPTPGWMQKLEVVLVARRDRLAAEQLAVVLWAMEQWRHVPAAPGLLPGMIKKLAPALA